ncbi:hypothetical protein M0804_009798 [Polistes exclamans]|nr:hypothetical protein M0804_009798 [Polistes exclamans]
MRTEIVVTNKSTGIFTEWDRKRWVGGGWGVERGLLAKQMLINTQAHTRIDPLGRVITVLSSYKVMNQEGNKREREKRARKVFVFIYMGAMPKCRTLSSTPPE